VALQPCKLYFVALLALGPRLLGGTPAWAAEPQEHTNTPPEGNWSDSTHERLQSLASELAAIADKYGNDSVALQASLMVESLRAGALAPTEVRVAGPSKQAGSEYLRFEVATGLIFDSRTSSERSCAAEIWRSVAAPVLAKMDGFDIRPAGVEFAFSYGLQDFSLNQGHRAEADQPYELFSLSIAIPAETLAALAAGEISTDDVLSRSRRVYSRPTPQ